MLNKKNKVKEERKEISMFEIMKHMFSDDTLSRLSKMALKEFMKEKGKQAKRLASKEKELEILKARKKEVKK
jgi:hypothetical protein